MDLVSVFEKKYERDFPGAWRYGTRPYQSTFTLVGLVAPGAAVGARQVVFLAQTAKALDYGSSDDRQVCPIPVVAGPMGFQGRVLEMSDADTNLATEHRTNGQEDFVITGIGLARRHYRLQALTGDPAAPAPFPLDGTVPFSTIGESADAEALGLKAVGSAGPFSAPSQSSLSDQVFDALLESASLRLVWSKDTMAEFGRAGIFPPGGGASVQTSHGVPDPQIGFEVPEGLLWSGEGGQSELTAELEIARPFIVGFNSPAPTQFGLNALLFVDVALVLRGVGFRAPLINAGGR